jgi:LysR family glycine cleavage system transcriptional activator
MRLSHLNGLKAFEATLRTGSFRAAARELGVTPAAVGQQIRGLESYLSCRLFQRTNRGTSPTEAAQRVEERLTSSFFVLGDVLSQLKSPRSENRIAVTLPASFAENWFTGHISDFYGRHSEVDLRLDASNRMVDLVAEAFDFAIRYCAPPDERYDETWLFGDFVLPVCSAEFAEKYGLSGAPRSLRDLPLIHLHNRTPDPQWADWDMWVERFGFEGAHTQTGLHFSQFSSGLQAALAGQGLVLCGVTEAFNALREARLVTPFGPELNCPTGYQYRLISLRTRSLTKLQQEFRNWVVETAEKFRDSIDRLLRRAA